MTTRTVTKEQIITALRTEKLRRRDWAHPLVGRERKCAVCAVGAVLRQCVGLKSQAAIRAAGYRLAKQGDAVTLSEVDQNLKDGKYLLALSCMFEGNDGYGGAEPTKAERAELVQLVKDRFPATIEVTV